MSLVCVASSVKWFCGGVGWWFLAFKWSSGFCVVTKGFGQAAWRGCSWLVEVSTGDVLYFDLTTMGRLLGVDQPVLVVVEELELQAPIGSLQTGPINIMTLCLDQMVIEGYEGSDLEPHFQTC